MKKLVRNKFVLRLSKYSIALILVPRGKHHFHFYFIKTRKMHMKNNLWNTSS